MAAPRTNAGMERSKYNAQKGGFYTRLLTCTEACIYKDICPIYNSLMDESKGKTFICSCILETLTFIRLKSSLQLTYDNLSEELMDEYIMLWLRVDRLRRYISLHADMTEEGSISKAYILLHRFQRKLLRLTEMILEGTS